MDYREYDTLRKKGFLTKETVLEASQTDDAGLLRTLATDISTGYFGYVNIEMSSELARKALRMDPRPYDKREAYELLIDNAMLAGSPYMDIIKEAMDDGVIPERPLRPTDSEYEFIRDNSADVKDFSSLLRFCWSHIYKADSYWTQRAMDSLKDRMSAGESALCTVDDLSTLSLFDCGEDYRNELLDMVNETLSRDDADDDFGITCYELHKALENINGRREDELLIRSARKGYHEALSEVFRRYPNAEESLKNEYSAAIEESIRKGKLNYDLDIDWHSYSPYDILPRPSIKVAIDYLNEGLLSGSIKKDSKEAVLSYVAIAKSMFAYGDKRAFRHLIECSWLNICPMLYSMLIDGFGTEKDEDTAREVAKAYDDNDEEKLKAILEKLRGR